MDFSQTSFTKTVFIAFVTLLMMSLVSSIIYLLAIDFIHIQYQQQFRTQLIIITVIASLATPLCYYLYRTILGHQQHQQSTVAITSEQHAAVATVLIVDDNPANCLIIDSILKSQNINTLLAYSGAEAIRLYQQHTPELIFMDIEMAGMNGFVTTEAIRAQEKPSQRIPIIAVSAHSEQDKKLQALRSGLDDYLVKPVKNHALLDTLVRWKIISKDDLPLRTVVNEVAPPVATPPTKEEPAPSNDTPPTSLSIDKIVSIEKSLEYSNQNKLLAKDMLGLLIKMIKDEKQNLCNLHQQRDWEALGQLTHKIYGGSCYCGVAKLQERCGIADKMLQQKNYQDIDQAIENLVSAMEEVLIWDEQYDIEVIFE